MAYVVGRALQRVPVEATEIADIDAGIARQGRFRKLHDPRAGGGGLVDLGEDLPAVEFDVAGHGELATGDA